MKKLISISARCSAAVILVACGQGPNSGATTTVEHADSTDQSVAPVTALIAPSCDETEVTETVQDAFDTHQADETATNLLLIAITDTREIGGVVHKSGEWKETRACAAKGSLSNNQKIDVWYQIKVPKTVDGVGYRVKPCFSDYDGLHKGDCEAFMTTPRP
ncbi:MAG: hypothetical protein R3E84_05280 [Pseudomonadales bacterium]